jgi:hypothetical protein
MFFNGPKINKEPKSIIIDKLNFDKEQIKQYDVYIQNEPFCYPFEGSKEKGWFRISIGNISSSNLDDVINTIEKSVVKSTSFVNSRIF